MAINKKSKSLKSSKELKQLTQELIDQVGNLRLMQKDIISRFQSNLEAEIVWCIKNLSLHDSDDRPAILNKKKELEELLDAIQTLKIKPQKGRLKDIRRINDLVNLINTKLID